MARYAPLFYRRRLLQPLAVILLGMLFVFSGKAFSQNSVLVESKLEWKGQDIDDNHITIKYDIPYNGVVELRLFDSKGKKIWQNYYIQEFGENRITLKRSSFPGGGSYDYVLNYKTDVVKHTFVLPVSGATP